ncbi:hypothetical protein I307_01624 [Cryptococcus deuterogattii 99/473]|nr:hypothetical protein I307_01624 [Cryptococcus deuterogattii 99/473]
MLPTTRQAYGRRLASVASISSLSTSPALPAESSRQAFLRAIASRPTHTDAAGLSRAGTRHQSTTPISGSKMRSMSSDAAATAWATGEDDCTGRYSKQRLWGKSSGPTGSDPIGPLPANKLKSFQPDLEVHDDFSLHPLPKEPSFEWLDSWLQSYDLAQLPPSPLPPLETFRGLILSHPLLALLTLPKLPHADLLAIRHAEVRALIWGVTKVTRDIPDVLLRTNPEDCAKSIRVLRAIIYALPSCKNSSDPFMGRYLRGKILRSLLALCYRLKCPRVAKIIFQERLREQLATDSDPPILPFEAIAQDLAMAREWQVIVELFSPETFPHRYFTSELIALFMQAHFGIHQSSKVPRIFELHDVLDLEPSMNAMNHLVQAFLHMGDLPTAKAIAKEANVTGGVDYASQQLAILWGYRSLGRDEDLEIKVLEDIERLELPLEARLLHALIRLRLDADEISKAEELLQKFNLTEWGVEGGGNVTPTSKTGSLLFVVASRKGDLKEVKRIWDKMCIRSEVVDDEAVTTLLRALFEQGRSDDALAVLQSALPNAPSTDSKWKLPRGVKPDIRAMNFVLGALSRERGIPGLELAMSLIHSFGIKPNNLTLKTIVDFSRSALRHSPYDLATLVTRIMESTPTLPPSQSLLDSILADAVSSSARTRNRDASSTEFSPSHSEDTFHPTAGLVLAPPLYSALSDIIGSLESIDSRSSSRSLANRLRYDAMTNADISGVPSARIVWNALIARGFNPDHRHVVALMQGYADAGHMYEVQDLLILASQIGIKTSKDMLMVLLTGWGKRRKPRHARKAYERIKSMGGKKSEGLDLLAVTAMIQAYSFAGKYKEAAQLCHTDLRCLGVRLDEKAVVVAAQALRSDGDLRGALGVMEANGKVLGVAGRKITRSIKLYARKQLLNGLDKEQQQDMNEVVQLAEQMIREDELARPTTLKKWNRLGAPTRKRLENAWSGIVSEGQNPDGVRGRRARTGKRAIVGRGKGVGFRALEARRERRRLVAKRRKNSVAL